MYTKIYTFVLFLLKAVRHVPKSYFNEVVFGRNINDGSACPQSLDVMHINYVQSSYTDGD